MPEAIKALVLDEITESRLALRRQLVLGDVDVVGETGLGTEAFALARDLQPHVIVLALEEPVGRGLRAIETLSLASPRAAIVVVSSLGDREHLRRTMLAGARDYLVKPFTTEELLSTVVRVSEIGHQRHHAANPDPGSGQHGSIITVFGAKGGVGKSTIATNLAVAIGVHLRQRVALVDLDTHLGDVAIMMDIIPERTIADAIQAADRLDSELLETFLMAHDSGVRVLPAPVRPEQGETIRADHISRILGLLTRRYDYVLVDTPRAFPDTVLTTLDMSNTILMVATLEVPCLKSTKLCLGMMRSWNYSEDKVKLVVNRADSNTGVQSSDIQRNLRYPIYWKMPSDFAVVVSSTNGRPFVQAAPDAKISRNVISLAEAVTGARQQSRTIVGRLLARV